MTKRIFVINGMAQSGKDTFISMVARKVSVKNYSSVMHIKEAASLLGWNGGKDERSRKFLSDMKKLSSEYNDFPYKKIENIIEEFYNDTINDVLFIHIREPEEITRIKIDYPEIRTILIVNRNVEHITSNESDSNVYNYEYDIVYHNEGTLRDLQQVADKFVDGVLFDVHS